MKRLKLPRLGNSIALALLLLITNNPLSAQDQEAPGCEVPVAADPCPDGSCVSVYDQATTTTIENMVNAHTGELVYNYTDMTVPGVGIDFVWRRTYQSKSTIDTPMGYGWDHTYNIYITASNNDLVLHDGSGREDIFTQQDGVWMADGFFRQFQDDGDGTLTLHFADKMQWQFHALDGSAKAGKISAIVDRNGNTIDLTYNGTGQLTTISDTLGRNYTVAYDGRGKVSSVSDFTGLQVTYQHYQEGDQNGSDGDLKSVTTPAVIETVHGNDFPDGRTTTFTYSSGNGDDGLNHNLTGITDANGDNFVTFTYSKAIKVDQSEPVEHKATPVVVPVKNTYDHILRMNFAGQIYDFNYASVSPGSGNNFASARTIVNNGEGNVSHYFFDQANRTVMVRKYTGSAVANQVTTASSNRPQNPLRADDPTFYEWQMDYNADSQQTAVTRPDGTLVSRVYDVNNPNPMARGNLLETRITAGSLGGDQAEIVEQFTYTAGYPGCCGSNYVTSATDGENHTTWHTYDSSGNRLSTTSPTGSVTEWEYDAQGRVTAKIWPDNGSNYRRRDEFTYYSSGPMSGYLELETQDVAGKAIPIRFEYDAWGRVTRKIDGVGGDELYSYNSLGELIVVTSPETQPGNGVRYTTYRWYDGNGNLVREDLENVDDAGITQTNAFYTTVHEYDSLGRRIRTCREYGNHTGAIPGTSSQPSCTGLSPADFVTEEFTYDNNDNIVLQRKGEATNGTQPNNTISRIFDAQDRVYQLTRAAGDTDQSSQQFNYDLNGNLTQVIGGLEGTPRTTTFTYDSYDRRTSETDPMGNLRTIAYDAVGNMLSEQLDGELVDVPGNSGNVKLQRATYTYDASNRRLTAALEHFDPTTQNPIGDGSSVNAWTYNDNNQVLTTTDDNNHTSTYTYNSMNQLYSVFNARGNAHGMLYDNNGNVSQYLTYEISDLGTPPELYTTTYYYDGLNRRVITVDQANNVEWSLHNSLNMRVHLRDKNGIETRWTFDGLNRMTSHAIDMDGDGANAADPADNVTLTGWDHSSRIISHTDDNNNTTTYDYDPLDRQTAVTLADGTGTTLVYDVHDGIVQTTDANQSVVDTTFDALGRTIRKDITAGPGVAPSPALETYTWDGRSKLISANDEDALVSRTYDSLGFMTSESQNGRLVTATYDGAGARLNLAYPGGRSLTYTHDVLERIDTITENTTTIADYDYLGDRVQRRTLANGVRLDYSFDGLNNAANDKGVKMVIGTKESRVSDGSVVDQRSYRWDANFNRVERYDVRTAGLKHLYGYDSADQLVTTDVTSGGTVNIRNTSYTYDGVGNRVQVNGDNYPGLYTMSPTQPEPNDAAVNQYTSTPLDSRAYDTNGNLTARLENGTLERLSFDYKNRLVSFDDGSGAVTTYSYDALDRRIEKVTTGGSNPGTTRFVYDLERVIEERDGSDAVQASYVYGLYLDEVLTMRRGGRDYYYHIDDRFSVMAITDANAAVVERYDYQDFGEPEITNPAGNPITTSRVGNTFMFTGRRYDHESGLYNYRRRYHDPRMGRFITRDPMGYINGLNMYTYVGNNPTTYLDPLGLYYCAWGDGTDGKVEWEKFETGSGSDDSFLKFFTIAYCHGGKAYGKIYGRYFDDDWPFNHWYGPSSASLTINFKCEKKEEKGSTKCKVSYVNQVPDEKNKRGVTCAVSAEVNVGESDYIVTFKLTIGTGVTHSTSVGGQIGGEVGGKGGKVGGSISIGRTTTTGGANRTVSKVVKNDCKCM